MSADGTATSVPGASWHVDWARTRDGRNLYVERRGPSDARPLVVMEAGLGMSHHTWGAVVERLSGSVATVTYDRSGLGSSPADPARRDLQRLADDLADLLGHLGDGPFVLVGHSWGGPIVRVVASETPERIAGLVLVDVTDENCEEYFGRAPEIQNRLATALLPTIARTGALRRPVDRLAALLPEPSASGMRRDDGTSSAACAQQAELRSHLDDLRRLRLAPPQLPEVPVTYVSGGSASRLERGRRTALVAAHRASADALPLGRHVIAPGSGHQVPFTDPDIVADEVLRLATPTD